MIHLPASYQICNFFSKPYVGSVLVKHLRQQYPDAILIGYDLGIFSHCLSTSNQIPETHLDVQYFGDARTVDRKVLDG